MFNQSYGFTLSSNIGFLYGTAYEIVYTGSGENNYLSELRWDIKPLVYFGLDLDFGPKEPLKQWGLFFGAGIKAAFPMETGVMEDRDWLPTCSVPGALTHFSSHENHTKAAFLLNLDSGFSLPLGKFVLKFFLNLDYMYFKWEAWNGYTQYGDNYPFDSLYIPWNSNSSFTKVPIYGLGITYSQHWILFNTGIGAELFLDRFTFSAAVFAGLPICIDIDEHHMGLRPFRTIGVLTRGFAVKPKLDVFLSLSDRVDIGLSAAFLYIGETRGNFKQKESGSVGVWFLDQEGARLKAFEGSFTIKYRF